MTQPLHDWHVTPSEAIRIQRELICPAVRLRKLRRRVRWIGGADVAFDKAGQRAFAAWVLYDVAAGAIVEQAWSIQPLTFPYVPGLLTFREGAVVAEAFSRLSRRPDLAMFDGTGYAHPRRCGLACHMGVLLDLPSIGVAKSRLCGDDVLPGPARGDRADLVDKGELVGAVLRTRDRVRPLYVSAGHLVNLDDAVRWTLACTAGYRLPEPTRQAHILVSQVKRDNL